MAFGQPAGPPASGRQVQELLSLLQDAGHTDFRDARGPMGFSQRQAAGKFTRQEVEAFIVQLQSTEDEVSPAGAAEPVRLPTRASAAEKLLQTMSTGELVAELRRRGWTVSEP
ncbi:MAG TPA: hypothetical protein VG014_08210 [Acidimicrobiales bacterium]|nr:hypothetical protein [Acidimicrobiales bacterium]